MRLPPQPISSWVQLRYAVGHFHRSAFEAALHNRSLDPTAFGVGSASTLDRAQRPRPSSMQPKTARFRTSAIVGASLCGAVLLCELMLNRAEGIAIQSHQNRWDCWARETSKVPACTAMRRLGPMDDADFCEAAVAVCKASGLNDKVNQAEERLLMWDRLARSLRIVVLASVACLLLWFLLAGVVRRTSQRTRT